MGCKRRHLRHAVPASNKIMANICKIAICNDWLHPNLSIILVSKCQLLYLRYSHSTPDITNTFDRQNRRCTSSKATVCLVLNYVVRCRAQATRLQPPIRLKTSGMRAHSQNADQSTAQQQQQNVNSVMHNPNLPNKGWSLSADPSQRYKSNDNPTQSNEVSPGSLQAIGHADLPQTASPPQNVSFRSVAQETHQRLYFGQSPNVSQMPSQHQEHERVPARHSQKFTNRLNEHSTAPSPEILVFGSGLPATGSHTPDERLHSGLSAEAPKPEAAVEKPESRPDLGMMEDYYICPITHVSPHPTLSSHLFQVNFEACILSWEQQHRIRWACSLAVISSQCWSNDSQSDLSNISGFSKTG